MSEKLCPYCGVDIGLFTHSVGLCGGRKVLNATPTMEIHEIAEELTEEIASLKSLLAQKDEEIGDLKKSNFTYSETFFSHLYQISARNTLLLKCDEVLHEVKCYLGKGDLYDWADDVVSEIRAAKGEQK